MLQTNLLNPGHADLVTRKLKPARDSDQLTPSQMWSTISTGNDVCQLNIRFPN
jgi:hypothetical protein